MVQLAVKNLSKVYRDADNKLAVIEALSYQFPSEGSVAIVGTSGVGKSTFLHLLGALDVPNSGEILYDDVDITKLSPDALGRFRGNSIGFVFQFHHLLPEFSALENVAMPLFIANVSEDEAMARAEKILDDVGLRSRMSHRPGTLSGGEQQRVAIARAIVSEPKVLLADEPTGNLDPSTAAQVQELLLEVNRRLGNLLVVVTHNPGLANGLGEILVMQPGGRLARQS